MDKIQTDNFFIWIYIENVIIIMCVCNLYYLCCMYLDHN